MIGRLIGSVVDRSIMFGFGVVGRMAGKSCVSGEVERSRFHAEALAEAESEIENWEPQSHAEFRDGGWWFHNEADHRFVVLEGSGNCQQCGCPRKAELREKLKGVDPTHPICAECQRNTVDCRCSIEVPAHPVDARHHGGYRMEVRNGKVVPIPILPEDQVDRVEAILEYHHVLDNPRYRDGLWCNCGTFCLNTTNHRRHVAQVITDLYAADERVAPVVRKHQQ